MARSPPYHSGDWSALAGWSPDLLKARVYEQILLDVIVGALAPGSRLDEVELSERYSAGLAGVREALGRLALEGLVVRKARAGTTVATLDLVEVRQALEARRLIEPHCAALAASHAQASDIAAMRAAFEGAEAAVKSKNARALVGMDQRFHVALARASRNATLARIVIPLQHHAARFWVYAMEGDSDEGSLTEIERHRALIDRIEAHDTDGARTGMLGLLGIFSDQLRHAAN